MDEPRAVRSVGPPDESRPDVHSAEEAELLRHDADETDYGGRTDADGNCASAADVEAEEVGARSPDPMYHR